MPHSARVSTCDSLALRQMDWYQEGHVVRDTHAYRPIDDSGKRWLIADLDARHEQRLESLLRSNRITRDELNQIIAEGRDKKW